MTWARIKQSFTLRHLQSALPHVRLHALAAGWLLALFLHILVPCPTNPDPPTAAAALASARIAILFIDMALQKTVHCPLGVYVEGRDRGCLMPAARVVGVTRGSDLEFLSAACLVGTLWWMECGVASKRNFPSSQGHIVHAACAGKIFFIFYFLFLIVILL